MTGPVGILTSISLFDSDADRDASNVSWNEGDLAYTRESGYGYYDGTVWEPFERAQGAGAMLSYVRTFGPDTATTIPANAWTPVVLNPAGEPWRLFGDQSWEWIPVGDPDYATSPAGIRCLREGVYSFAGACVFDPGQGTGNRAVRILEVKGPYAGQWQLATGIPMPKGTLIPVLVAGEAYQYVGNIVELQVWSDAATQTTTDPQSEWLSACLVATPAPAV